MDFRIIRHTPNETIIEWIPSIFDRIAFGRKHHVATYVPNNGGYKLWNTNKPVRKVTVPDAEFFGQIKNTTI